VIDEVFHHMQENIKPQCYEREYKDVKKKYILPSSLKMSFWILSFIKHILIKYIYIPFSP
jgi:hypothetical protein